ncbi:MAG: hypothetical protein H7A23_15360 [Leptospiraceae bacterium]|nr:hypothetical protein [Leptospiraceae bacterium]MCP5495928.1 hypothetical protein [Leptospiraceae bacterium]
MANIESSYSEMMSQLTELVLKTKDREAKKVLRDKHKEMRIKLKKIIDLDIEKSTKEYEKLMNSLEKVNHSIHESLKDVNRVNDTINFLTQSLNIIGKLI